MRKYLYKVGVVMSKKINIDVWRFVLAFLIVAIHISPFDNISPNFDFFFTRILGRIAVPLFLMITGYYLLYDGVNNNEKLISYTKKIVKVYLFCIILYIPINIYMGKFESISFVQIFKDVFINGTLYHLWYFPALIFGLWITYFLMKKLNNKVIFVIVVALYLIGLFGDSYYGITYMSNMASVYDGIFKFFDYTRNGLFFVPIFLYLGYVVRVYKVNSKWDFVFSILFFVCMTIESMVLHYFNFQRHDSMYVFLIPLMFFLFRFLISKNSSSNKVLRDVSTLIYIFHPFFIVVVRFVSGIFGLEKILVLNNLIFYIIVSLVTLLFSVFVERIIFLIKNKNVKK